MRAFLGSVRILTSMLSLSEWKGTRAGKRPTNSGIIPKSIKSPASTPDNKRTHPTVGWPKMHQRWKTFRETCSTCYFIQVDDTNALKPQKSRRLGVAAKQAHPILNESPNSKIKQIVPQNSRKKFEILGKPSKLKEKKPHGYGTSLWSCCQTKVQIRILH